MCCEMSPQETPLNLKLTFLRLSSLLSRIGAVAEGLFIYFIYSDALQFFSTFTHRNNDSFFLFYLFFTFELFPLPIKKRKKKH